MVRPELRGGSFRLGQAKKLKEVQEIIMFPRPRLSPELEDKLRMPVQNK